jgi:hypothetical protein
MRQLVSRHPKKNGAHSAVQVHNHMKGRMIRAIW